MCNPLNTAAKWILDTHTSMCDHPILFQRLYTLFFHLDYDNGIDIQSYHKNAFQYRNAPLVLDKHNDTWATENMVNFHIH